MFSVTDRDFWFKEKLSRQRKSWWDQYKKKYKKNNKKIHRTHTACPVNTPKQQFMRKKQVSIQTSAEHCQGICVFLHRAFQSLWAELEKALKPDFSYAASQRNACETSCQRLWPGYVRLHIYRSSRFKITLLKFLWWDNKSRTGMHLCTHTKTTTTKPWTLQQLCYLLTAFLVK